VDQPPDAILGAEPMRAGAVLEDPTLEIVRDANVKAP
jgi:hypothetical protein